MKEKTHKKLNISLPNDLHAWVIKRQAEENKKSRLSKTAISTIIADAVEQAKAKEEEQGKVQSGVGVKIRPAFETFGSGHLTPRKNPSRKAG